VPGSAILPMQFAPESEVWRREHGIGSIADPGTLLRYKARAVTSRPQAATVPGEPL